MTGATHVAVGTEEGRVVLRFPKDVGYVALDPGIAAQVGKAVIDAAVDLGVEVKIEVQQRQLSDMRRMNLYTRAGHIIRSMSEKTPPQIAVQVVDSILQEVL